MNAWLFDIDGVLTDPNTKQIPSSDILSELYLRINQGDIIGFNTGRSLDFVLSRLLHPLEQLITDKSLLKNIITIAEKGGLSAIYDDHGHLIEDQDSQISVPSELSQKIKLLVNQHNYASTMFFDHTKRTMISIEMIDNPNQDQRFTDEFKKNQLLLNQQIKQLLIDLKLDHQIKVDPTIIATDVESNLAGKAYGTEKFINILQEFDLRPEKYFSFGDSPSDYQMHQQLTLNHHDSTFIFVGDQTGLSEDKLLNCHLTQHKLTAGTLEYLKQ